jgi:hypothetical protein
VAVEMAVLDAFTTEAEIEAELRMMEQEGVESDGGNIGGVPFPDASEDGDTDDEAALKTLAALEADLNSLGTDSGDQQPDTAARQVTNGMAGQRQSQSWRSRVASMICTENEIEAELRTMEQEEALSAVPPQPASSSAAVG